MAVFPETMNRLDLKDTAGSLKRVEDYIRYITERVELSNRAMMQSVGAAGSISIVAIYNKLEELATAVDVLQREVNKSTGNITALAGRVDEMQTSITGLQESMKTTQESVTALQAELSALKESITALDGRVTALEGGTTEGT